MAGSASDFLELELLDHVLGNAAYTAPATTYIALATAAITDADTGSTITEPIGNGYARVAFTNNATNWPVAAAGAKANGVAITFATASGGNWGTVTHFAILDALTLGNMLLWGDLTVSKVINDGDTAEFAIGDLDVTLD